MTQFEKKHMAAEQARCWLDLANSSINRLWLLRHKDPQARHDLRAWCDTARDAREILAAHHTKLWTEKNVPWDMRANFVHP